MNMRKITLVLAFVLAMLLSVSLAYADGYTAKVNADVEIPVAVDGPIVYVTGDYSADEPVPFTVEWFAEPAEEDAEPYAVLNMLLMPDGKLNVAQDTQFTASLREVLALQIAESDADHRWNSGVELAPADCQNQGIVMAECKDCYAMKFSLINGSHAYGAWQIVTEPTCTEVGIRKMTCSVCGSTLQEKIDMLDHTPMIDEAVEPTCTETGLTEGKHCSVCNTVLVKQEEIAALGHTEVTDAAVAPTHTETGLTEGSHCSVCGETLVAQEVIPATGYSVFMTIKSETFTSVIHDQYAAMMVYAPDGLPIESKDGYTFVGYRTDAGTLYQVGELIPMDEFTEQDDAYYINLTVAFEKDETEDPDVVYTDVDSYTAYLTIVSPIAYDLSVTTETYTFDPAKDASVGTVSYPSSRQLAVYVRKGLTPIGFRSLVTGNTFSIGDIYALDKLPAAVYAGQTVTDVSETEKLRVSNYEINDKLIPLYSFFGASGAFLDPLYSCEITFYATDPIDDSQNTSAPVTTIGTQTISGITMDELTASDYVVSLQAAPAYDGYIFNGYGLLTGSSVSIDGNQLVLNDVIADLAGQDGHLYLSLKLHYSIDTRCPECGADDTAAITEAKAPTCTETGLTEGKHCSVCNAVLVKQEELPATGHKFASYGMCEVCRYMCTHPHGLTDAGYYSDADHYGYCDVHNGTGIEEHTFEYTSVNDYEHTVSCKHCGYSFNEAHDIDFVPEDGTAFCKICKAEFGW